MNSVSVNGFSLSVLGDGISARKKYMNGANYFLLPHGSQYKLRLTNNRSPRCDAEVWIDGERIGTWRINSYSSVTIERPADINRRFVFLRENSCTARTAGIVSGDSDNGLIKVIFKPERQQEFMLFNNNLCSLQGANRDGECHLSGMMNMAPLSSMMDMASRKKSLQQSYSHGATALGGTSGQEFDTTSSIYNVDTANITTITARLLVDNDLSCDYKPLVSLKSAVNETNYPSRLDDTRHWPLINDPITLDVYHPVNFGIL